MFRLERTTPQGLINNFMNSPSWTDSAMIFTYDEAGGFYDHVPPQPMAAPGGVPGSDLAPYSPFDLNPALGDICTKNQPDTRTRNLRFRLDRVSGAADQRNFAVCREEPCLPHTVRDATAVLAEDG